MSSPPRDRTPAKGERVAAPTRSVARICVDVPLAHLDRPFDYRVPDTLDADAVPGARVRVRFAGRLVDGYLLERADTTEHTGKLGWLERVTSPEPVLAPEVAALARAVADRCAGTLIDVLRLAIPPRHARTEQAAPRERVADPSAPDLAGWDRYPRGRAFLDAVAAGRPAHGCWQALPGEDWPARLAEAAVATAATGRGALLVLPDHRDTERVRAAVAQRAGDDAVVVLAADTGPAERYRRWLAVRRGAVRIVVGTRGAAFAPVADLGLAVLWDDGDDLLAEPRSPYPHARLVLGLRAAAGASLLIGGFARTAESQLLVDTGWAHEIVAPRETLRGCAPRVTALAEDDARVARDPAARAARLPAVAFDAARAALAANRPVLVQVPRRGYVPSLACGGCRAPARCRVCAGPLAVPVSREGAAAAAACRWCGATEGGFRCQACGSRRLRAVVIGARRTAEELGRAFPGAVVRTSGAGEVIDTVDDGPALVIATPGAEPAGRYGAALLLDGWALLGRPGLRAAEEALRRWMTAAAMVVPGVDGGQVVVVAESTLSPVQALVRWDPVGHAAAELAERRELGFPPAMRMAAVDGPPQVLLDLADALPVDVEALGPVPVPGGGRSDADPERERLLVRVPRERSRELAALLAGAQAARTARKEAEALRVEVDPMELA